MFTSRIASSDRSMSVRLNSSAGVALNGKMWVHLNTSEVQPSRHELHEQLNSPVMSSRRVVTHIVGRSTKSPTSVEIAGSTYSGTRNSSEAPAVTERKASPDVVSSSFFFRSSSACCSSSSSELSLLMITPACTGSRTDGFGRWCGTRLKGGLLGDGAPGSGAFEYHFGTEADDGGSGKTPHLAPSGSFLLGSLSPRHSRLWASRTTGRLPFPWRHTLRKHTNTLTDAERGETHYGRRHPGPSKLSPFGPPKHSPTNKENHRKGTTINDALDGLAAELRF
uniref:Uncharacterized protein n=1 Tax=Anopheles farauti TaxID=69004 RepID=A0A182R0L5_9DIPT